MKVKKRKPPRHPFRFRVKGEDGKVIVLTGMAKVRKATQPVTLVLTADDVRESIRRKGVGNTHDCSMAVCAQRLANHFPHPVDRGFIDRTYNMAYVVTKHNAETALPCECVAYAHHDSIAKLNDTAAGQKKLLALLEKEGDRTINLYPPVYKPREKGRVRGKNTGERARVKSFKGAKQRYAAAKMGGAFEV